MNAVGEKLKISNNTDSERNFAIDGIRGVVALIIALFHYELYVPFGSNKLFATGYLGVEFFFVLSGFLLTRGICLKEEKYKFSVAKIMKEKVRRLYPPYFIATLLLVFLYAALWFDGNILKWLNSDITHFKGFLSELFCIQSTGALGFNYINGPAWYVSALLISSLIILILIKYLQSMYIKFLSPIISIILYLSLFMLNTYMDPSSYIYGIIPTALVRALAGMMLGTFVWFLFSKISSKLKKTPYVFICVIEIVIVISFFRMLLFRTPSKWNYLIILPIIGILLVGFSTKGILSKFFSMKFFTILGKISYSFYLLQSICSNFVLNAFSDVSPWVKIVIYILLNFVAAFIMNYLVENLFCNKLLKINKPARSLFILGASILSICVLILYNNMFSTLNKNKGDLFEITALNECNESAEGTEIWIKSVIIDGRKYSANEVFGDEWIVQSGKVGWKSYDQPDGLQTSLCAIIPYGSERKIIFESNKWRGKAQISLFNKDRIIDCYAAFESGEITIDLEASLMISDNKLGVESKEDIVIILMWLVSLTISVLLLFKYICNTQNTLNLTKEKHVNLNERKIWIDFLRLFCMFNIVLLHGTCDGFVSSYPQKEIWFNYLYINCFTVFAVPIFFMISGSLIIKQEKDYIRLLIYRLKKILIPLFIWSIVYIFMRKYYLGENISIIKQILKIATEPQYWHLWFIYTISGLYILSPLISHIYYNTDKKMLKYLGIVFGILPLVLKTLEAVTNYNLNISILYIFFPETMLFILGKVIVDNKKKFLNKWFIWVSLIFIGYGSVVLMTYYKTIKLDYPFKGFFSNYGTLPLFIMYTSIFILFSLLDEVFIKVNYKLKKIVYVMSEATMGIYFIHMLVYMVLDNKKVFGLFKLTNKSNSIIVNIFTALICFMISFAIILFIKKLVLLIKSILRNTNN